MDLLLAKAKINDDLTVDCLLQEGIDVNSADVVGNTSLHIAASEGHVNVISVLLDHKADVSVRNKYDMTPVMTAAASGQDLALDLLLERFDCNVDLVNIKNHEGSTPLIMAAKEGFKAVVERLLRCQGILLDEVDSQGNTALHKAVLFHQQDIFDLLLKEGADPLIPDHQQTTPLMSAASRGLEAVVTSLLKTKNNVNAVNSKDETALHMAVRAKSLPIAKALVAAAAELDIFDNMQLTPVLRAVQDGPQDLTIMLLQAGCDPTCTDLRGRNVLHHAVTMDRVAVVEHLIEAGMDLNVTTLSGNRPIILAVCNGNFSLTKLFLDHNCYLDLPESLTQYHSSLMTISIQKGRNDICELLYKAGCNVRVPDIKRVLRKIKFRERSEFMLGQFWIHQITRYPRSLQDICRIVVRNALGCSLKTSVNSLPVPPSLHRFLLIEAVSSYDKLNKRLGEHFSESMETVYNVMYNCN